MKLTNCVASLALVGMFGSGGAEATLLDRGGGLLYDTVLNVTWLQDANYAKTSGYDADGVMTWSQANAWANNLVYGGFSDWRLASNNPVNGSTWNYNFSYNGSTDYAYNITSVNSELSYMYYLNLGLHGSYTSSGTGDPNYGVFGNGAMGGQANVGLVKNLQSGFYWSGTAYAADPANKAWVFVTYDGPQIGYTKNGVANAWAVRDGDVGANGVPEPAGSALAFTGLVLLGLARRHQKAV